MEPEDINNTKSDAEKKGFSTEMNKVESQQAPPPGCTFQLPGELKENTNVKVPSQKA